MEISINLNARNTEKDNEIRTYDHEIMIYMITD